MLNSNIIDDGYGPRLISVSPEEKKNILKNHKKEREKQEKSYIVRGRESFFKSHADYNEKNLMKVSQFASQMEKHDIHKFHSKYYKPHYFIKNRRTVFSNHISVYDERLAERILEQDRKIFNTYFGKSYVDNGLGFSSLNQSSKR